VQGSDSVRISLPTNKEIIYGINHESLYLFVIITGHPRERLAKAEQLWGARWAKQALPIHYQSLKYLPCAQLLQ